MGIIINVTKTHVYIEEKAVYYKISKELFTFKPKVGSVVKVLTSSDGKILKIIFIDKTYQTKKERRKIKLLSAVKLYTLLFGSAIIMLLSEPVHQEREYFLMMYIIAVVMISFTIISMINKKLQTIFFLINYIFYSLILIIGLILIIRGSYDSGLKTFVVSLLPVVLNSIYIKTKEETDIPIVRRFWDI